MPAVKVRGPTRENRPFTGRVIQIQARNIHSKYSVHEDLLCATSELSRNLLQKRGEGACAICHEVLNPAIADMTFYKMQCDGHNVHQDCIDEWKAMNPAAAPCSICEAIQESRPSIVSLPSKIDLDPKAVQLYIDWLYADTIRVGPDVAAESSDDYNVCLLRAWSVAAAAQDKEFEHAVIAHLVSQFDEQKNAGFGAASVTYAFETAEHESMRTFIRKYSLGVGMTESVKQATGGVVKVFHDEVHKSRMEKLRNSVFELVGEGEPRRQEELRRFRELLRRRGGKLS
jgi:hypothetical protein